MPWLFVCYKANNQIFILEKSNDVGGTWRENRYPGAACDVQSHMYSLSFAPKTDWSKRYAEAPEIFDYIQDITNQYQIKTTVSLTMRLLMYSMMKCAMYGH
ncbi:Baeyer-Villiger monooxygenase [Acinetobacter baumannii]|nr:Baeyer-Villiger monooxygenase [Acinetobacter baumannii]